MSTSFPSTHTTTTTSTTTSNDKKLYINVGYIKTQHGQLKVIHMITCLLAFICVMAAGYPYNKLSNANYISFVTVCGLLTSGILFFLYFINAVVYFTIIPWVLLELVYSALWTFFTFVGGIVAATDSAKYGGGVGSATAAAAFFLFMAMCFYGYYAFRVYLLYKQGVRLVIVTTEITTTTTSANHP